MYKYSNAELQAEEGQNVEKFLKMAASMIPS
jgi:hypothetical protein